MAFIIAESPYTADTDNGATIISTGLSDASHNIQVDVPAGGPIGGLILDDRLPLGVARGGGSTLPEYTQFVVAAGQTGAGQGVVLAEHETNQTADGTGDLFNNSFGDFTNIQFGRLDGDTIVSPVSGPSSEPNTRVFDPEPITNTNLVDLAIQDVNGVWIELGTTNNGTEGNGAVNRVRVNPTGATTGVLGQAAIDLLVLGRPLGYLSGTRPDPNSRTYASRGEDGGTDFLFFAAPTGLSNNDIVSIRVTDGTTNVDLVNEAITLISDDTVLQGGDVFRITISQAQIDALEAISPATAGAESFFDGDSVFVFLGATLPTFQPETHMVTTASNEVLPVPAGSVVTLNNAFFSINTTPSNTNAI